MRSAAFAVALAAAFLISLSALALPPRSQAQGSRSYQYLSPSPGSRLVSPWNNIVIRHASIIDRSGIDDRALSVTGSQSGIHTGRLVLSDDMKTLVFNPDRPFALSETVVVRLEQGVRALGGEGLPALSFSFTVSATDPKQQPVRRISEVFPDLPVALGGPRRPASSSRPLKPASLPCDTLPPDYPLTTVLYSNDPDPVDLFIAPFNIFNNSDGHLLILDELGKPVFYRTIRNLGATFDFKRQPNGLLTYFQDFKSKFFALDSAYAVVDSFETGNGYQTDLHEFQLLPDSHALLMSYDLQRVDMSAVVPGGNPNAWVYGLIIQELDGAKNVAFQWRSWDHFAITDCNSPQFALTDSVIDYVHGNAIELDYDGNLLLSSRHLNEVTKINRETGDIIWRLGLNATQNQFTFVNDSRGFVYQHDIRRLANGHVTLHDNGNYSTPVYSRAVEYDLDEVNKVATLVWEYRNTPDVYGGFMGNAQRQTNGGTTIGWGGTFSNPKLTEVHADGSKALELGFDDSGHFMSYRSFGFPWRTNRFAVDADSLDFGVVAVGSTVVRSLTVRNTSGSDVTIGCFVTTDPAFVVQGSVPITLPPDSSVTVDVACAPADPGIHDARLYVRQVGDDELVAQVVAMQCLADGNLAVPGPGASRFDLEVNRPNPFSQATAIGFTMPRAGKVRLDIIDVHGRKVETLVDDVRPAGRIDVKWTPKNRANGIYFCRLQSGDLVETRKLVLRK